MRVSSACCTYTQAATSILSFLSLIPSAYLSFSFCIFKSAAHLSPECRSRVCRLTRADITADFFSPPPPVALLYLLPLASALFVPFLCPLFLLSSCLSLCAQFSFLLAAARSFCSISRRSQTFPLCEFRVRISCTIFSFSITFAVQ